MGTAKIILLLDTGGQGLLDAPPLNESPIVEMKTAATPFSLSGWHPATVGRSAGVSNTGLDPEESASFSRGNLLGNSRSVLDCGSPYRFPSRRYLHPNHPSPPRITCCSKAAAPQPQSRTLCDD